MLECVACVRVSFVGIVLYFLCVSFEAKSLYGMSSAAHASCESNEQWRMGSINVHGPTCLQIMWAWQIVTPSFILDNMSKIPAVTDYANPSLILDSLRAVGRFLRDSLEEAAAQECSSLPDDAYKSAAESLHLLARYLQYDAPEAQKNQLGDSIATDPDVIDCLYEGILIPFIQGD